MRGLRLYGWLLLAPGLLLVVFALVVPLLGIFQLSLGERSTTELSTGFTFENYARVFTEARLRDKVVMSLTVSAIAGCISLAMALPVSYFISRSGPRLKSVMTILLLLPMLGGGVVLSIGWVALLSPSGLLSHWLQEFGLLQESLKIMQTAGTVTAVLALVNLPIVVLSILGLLDSVGDSTEKAAISLGSSRFRAYRTVVLPQIMPGIVVGSSLVFVLAVNAYVTPLLIGGARVGFAAPEIYQTINIDGNWPQGSALAIVLVSFSLTLSGLYTTFMARRFDKWRELKR